MRAINLSEIFPNQMQQAEFSWWRHLDMFFIISILDSISAFDFYGHDGNF